MASKGQPRHRSEFRQFSSVSIKHKKSVPASKKESSKGTDTSHSNKSPQPATQNVGLIPQPATTSSGATPLPGETTPRLGVHAGAKRPTSPKSDGRATRFNRRPIQKPGRREIPISIESEHRQILSVANHSLLELKGFRRGFLTEGVDYARCKDTARDVVRRINLEEGEIQRADEFRKILATRKLGHEIQNRDEITHLEVLCDKSAKYEEMMPDILSKLSACFQKHLAKYCLSFSEEAGKDVYIKCVADYNEIVNNYKTNIEEKLKEINSIYEEYGNASVPFLTVYLESVESLLTKMDGCTSKAIEICDMMKKWILYDKKYPVQLWDEITHDNLDRSKKQDEIKKIRNKKEELAIVLHRKELIRDKAAAKFSEVKLERKKLKTHKENLEKRIEQTDGEISDRQKELEVVMDEYSNRKSNSPKYVDMLWSKKELLEMELFKLEERRSMLKRQQERYEKLDGDLEEQLSDLEYDVMGKQGDVDDVRGRIKSCDQDTSQLTKDLKMIESKIAACKLIREMKLSAATLRKIYFQKLDSSSQDMLMEVCKVVATNIGREWEALYLDLLFTPPRSKEKRNKDLEYIKLNSVRREVTGQKLAWQGLQKWRIFNKNGNIQQLLRSLRRLEKYALAHKVEHMHKKAATAVS